MSPARPLPTALFSIVGALGLVLTAVAGASAQEAMSADPAAAITPDRGVGVTDEVAEDFARRNGRIFVGWPQPSAVLVLTGELDGYIEPCGCTGKENQKGGLSRRQNFLRALEGAGWPVVPIDLGGQVKRFGRQTEIKFQSIAEGLKAMGYDGVGLGPSDLRLPTEGLVAAVAAVGDSPTPFLSANVGLYGLDTGITPRSRVVEMGGLRIGITAVLGDRQAAAVRNETVEITSASDGLRAAATELATARCDHQVLLAWTTAEEAAKYAALFPQFDIVVAAGGADEPPNETPLLPADEGRPRARLVELGHKGMYAVAIGLFPGESTPLRTQRVPLDARWGESEDMIRLLGEYQGQLERLGLDGLGVAPIRHPTGRRFAGSAACAECHQASYDIWKESGHAQALTTLETQSPRRDGDPECLSCHVVGWVPQKYEPFEGGFAGMAVTPHLAHQGCENCHGPAATHTAVERGDVKATDEQRDRLRSDLALSLATPEERERAVNNCLECHDLDNSPKFDFDTYWPMIEHSEKDTPDSK
ncbi:MAG: multiheme c-type cytochrome [Pirellulales bacterium]